MKRSRRPSTARTCGPRARTPRVPGARVGLLGVCLAVWLGAGCATTEMPRLSASSDGERPSGNPERPEAPAEYDFLVGSLAAMEGRPEEARAAFERAAAKDPDSAYLERTLGRLSAQLDDLDSALAHAQRAVELQPDDAEARLFLGRLQRIRRDIPGAEAALIGADGQPISAEAALLLYQIYLESGELEKALTVAEEIVGREPDSLGGHMAVATVYERMGMHEESEAALRRALRYHPGRFVLYTRLARMRRAADDRKGEIEVYREVLVEHPRHYGTLVSLGEAQIAVDDIEGAIATYKTVLQYYPDDLQSVRRIASLEYATGRHERAAQHLETALDRHPERFELAYALGQVWRGVGDEDRALEAFRMVEPGHEVYVDARLQIAEILEQREEFKAALVEVERVRALKPSRELDFHTAALHWKAGDLEGGVALLEAMLEENPKDDEVVYQLGVLYGLAKQVDLAIETMERALALNPDNAHALNYIGYTWAERGERLDEAERYVVRALELRPGDGYITDSLGWVYYMRARPLIGAGRVEDGRALLEQAREQLSLAAELTGGDPVVSEHLGDVYMALEQKEQALYFYEEAVSLEPRPEEQPELMDKLEDLRQELQRQ